MKGKYNNEDFLVVPITEFHPDVDIQTEDPFDTSLYEDIDSNVQQEDYWRAFRDALQWVDSSVNFTAKDYKPIDDSETILYGLQNVEIIDEDGLISGNFLLTSRKDEKDKTVYSLYSFKRKRGRKKKQKENTSDNK